MNEVKKNSIFVRLKTDSSDSYRNSSEATIGGMAGTTMDGKNQRKEEDHLFYIITKNI
ncbi:MAG: hypothetical protein HY841_01085 [Bacteroidetes bacterium]|nr:hypothetical protein [Bacteroidota bacterium]